MVSVLVDFVGIGHSSRVHEGNGNWDGDMKSIIVKVGGDIEWPSDSVVRCRGA